MLALQYHCRPRCTRQYNNAAWKHAQRTKRRINTVAQGNNRFSNNPPQLYMRCKCCAHSDQLYLGRCDSGTRRSLLPYARRDGINLNAFMNEEGSVHCLLSDCTTFVFSCAVEVRDEKKTPLLQPCTFHARYPHGRHAVQHTAVGKAKKSWYGTVVDFGLKYSALKASSRLFVNCCLHVL